MTDNEIIKALECCVSSTSSEACEGCPFNEMKVCDSDLYALEKYALSLIKSQMAEIERLRKRLDFAEQSINEIEDALYRGISNDYAEEAIQKYYNLVKEMTEDEE